MHSRSNTTRFGKATIAMFAAFVLFTFHQIASADDSPSATKWHPWIDFAGFAGTDGQSRGEVGLFVPLVQNPDSMLFGDLRVRLFENDIREGNFAIGYRTMLDNGWNAGAWMGFDVRETSFNNVFRQVSGGLEYLLSTPE